ncbi:MAG: HAD family hydrolase [Verrucomicrobiales bacterium]|nr:HAD family hydrolase [Verrucomicrobiales bacterium]
MPVKAVIFDLDGTLLDTLEDLADSMNEALASMGFPVHAVERYRYFVGDGVQMLTERTLPEEHRTPDILAEVRVRYRAAYGRNWKSKSRPYDGILPALECLRQCGLPLAILSNKPQQFTELCMEHFFPNDLFYPIFGAREQVERKPSPDGALEIANLLGIQPGEMAFIGDTLTDMRTAVAAGMRRIGVAWGFRPVEELLANGAECIASHPRELAGLLTD